MMGAGMIKEKIVRIFRKGNLKKDYFLKNITNKKIYKKFT